MSVGPFPVGRAIARLATAVSQQRIIGNGAQLRTALETAPSMMPAAYVLAEERGDAPTGMAGRLIQTAHVAVQVVLYVQNFAQEATGGAARTEMDALITDVRAALIGWSPSSAYMSLSLTAARDESYKAGTLICQEIYRTQYRITQDRIAHNQE